MADTEAPAKSVEDFGKDVKASLKNNSTAGLPPIIEEMKATLPPVDPNAPPVAAPVPEPPKQPTMEEAIAQLTVASNNNNVSLANEVATAMCPEAEYNPAPPPVDPPPVEPPPVVQPTA